LTAAAAVEEALEVRKLGHGVFTAALIGALHHGDTNNDGAYFKTPIRCATAQTL
jgi:uncharacterized caspase-like protein